MGTAVTTRPEVHKPPPVPSVQQSQSAVFVEDTSHPEFSEIPVSKNQFTTPRPQVRAAVSTVDLSSKKGINLRPNKQSKFSGGMYSVPKEEPFSPAFKAVMKAFSMLLLVVATSAISIYVYDTYFNEPNPNEDSVVVRTNYTNAYWQTYGEVFEPIVNVPIYYPNEGYRDQEFLLDSGAVVSSLPRERAAELGLSLAKLPRIVFGGFGGTTSFGYQSDLKIMIGGDEISIPVVFTESEGTKPILGRSGFFEQYSIVFNARSRKIEIIK